MCTTGEKMLRGNDLVKYGWTVKSLENVAYAAFHLITLKTCSELGRNNTQVLDIHSLVINGPVLEGCEATVQKWTSKAGMQLCWDTVE